MFTRRTATVTMSAPEASCACAITGNDEYFPVPTMSRDLNVRAAMTNGVSVNSQRPHSPITNRQSTTNHQSKIAIHQCSLATTNEIHDLDRVAFTDDDLGKPTALDDVLIVLDRNPARI